MKTQAFTYTTIDPPGSTYTIANGINDKGDIVGFYQDGSGNPLGNQHGFVESGATYTTIDPPGSVQTTAAALLRPPQFKPLTRTRVAADFLSGKGLMEEGQEG